MSTIRRSLGSSLWIAIAIAVLGGAALTSCGSTGHPTRTVANAGGGRSSPLQFSRCMRANGVPSFPDPGPHGYQLGPGSGIKLQSPAGQSALNACEKGLPQSGHAPPTPASVRRQEIALAKCMRSHGVPNFPDPDANGNIQFPVGSPILQSPAFQSAQNACKGYLSR